MPVREKPLTNLAKGRARADPVESFAPCDIMNRFLLFSFCFLGTPPLVAGTTAKPNILFLLSDDQAWNGLSCRMHPDMPDSANAVIETPNIARLAGEGMRFSQAYSPASVCSPTRISLQTGKSPAQCQWTKAAPPEAGFKLVEPRIRKNIEAEETTIGELLQSAGYATAHFGKWHIGGGGPESHGYDEGDGNTGNEAAAPHFEPNPVDIFGMNDRAVAFMEKSKRAGKPFFIQMSYNALHYPENASQSLIQKYAALLPDGNEKEIGMAAISEDLDRGVGELLASLARLQLAENTYVLYMSDNGGSTRRTLSGGKGGVWEGGIRVPLIIRGPGIAADSWCHQRVVGYDFFPTFCEWAGVTQPLPRGIEGGSIISLLRGGNTPVKRPREELVFHFPHYQGDTPHTALILGDYKLLHFYEDDSLQLYDLSRDIREAADLAGSLPEKVREMKVRMDAYLREVDAQFPTPNPDYDPTDPPSSREKKGGKGGKGGAKGKGR
jgi:arylsulfatase A